MTLSKGHNSTKGDHPDKNTGQLFFYAESLYEILKPYLKLVMDRQAKAICPFKFFKVRGIMKKTVLKQGWSILKDPYSAAS